MYNFILRICYLNGEKIKTPCQQRLTKESIGQEQKDV